MNKKVLIAIVTAMVLVVAGLLAWSISNDSGQADEQNSEASKQQVKEREAAALQEARDYRPAPGVSCLMVLTPARHIDTGVTHTFSSSCLPAGWEAVDRPTDGDQLQQPADNDDDTSVSPIDQTDRSTTDMGNSSTGDDIDRAESARQAALREAERYQPPKGTSCITVMTPARHIATGATYTFSNGCLPDGWEAIRTADPGFRQ